MENNNHIEDVAYEKYQLDWMINHGVSINNLIEELDKTYKEYVSNGVEFSSLREIYDEWEFSEGFGGSIWACKDEFLKAEYRDKEYIEGLLSGNEYEEYLEETERQEDGLEEIEI